MKKTYRGDKEYHGLWLLKEMTVEIVKVDLRNGYGPGLLCRTVRS